MIDEGIFKDYIEGKPYKEEEVFGALRSLVMIVISRYFFIYRKDEELISEGVFHGIRCLKSEKIKERDNILSLLFTYIRNGLHRFLYSKHGDCFYRNKYKANLEFRDGYVYKLEAESNGEYSEEELFCFKEYLYDYVSIFEGLGIDITNDINAYLENYDLEGRNAVLQSVVRASVFKFLSQ